MEELPGPLLHQGAVPSSSALSSVLRECIKYKNLALGRHMQTLSVFFRLASRAPLGHLFIQLFSSCGGSLLEANLAFCNVTQPCAFTWHAIIAAHSDIGESEPALYLFAQMRAHHVKPCKYTFSSALKACGATGVFQAGTIIHDLIKRDGLERNLVLRGGLVTMYAKCGLLKEAHYMFDKTLHQNEVLWGALVLGYVEHGHGLAALGLLEKMQAQALVPDKVMFLSLLKACSSKGVMEQGKLMHAQIINMGLDSDTAVGTSLVDMYAKSGQLTEAQGVFDKMSTQNVISYGALITGYTQNGQGLLSMILFEEMQRDRIMPDKYIFSSILKACSSIGAVLEGMQIHDCLIRTGLEPDVDIETSLLDLYAKWGCLREAFTIFETVNKNTVSWNAIIAGCIESEQSLLALKVLGNMQKEAINPDKVTLLLALKACACTRDGKQGRLVHSEILERGFELEEVVRSTLVDMYAECGFLRESREVFDVVSKKDSVSWASMVYGYAKQGHGLFAIEVFESMWQHGIDCTRVSLSSVLKSCSAIKQGRCIHDCIIRSGLELDEFVVGALIHMYARFGSLEEAHRVLDEFPRRNTVVWNSIIMGHANHQRSLAALDCYSKMQREGIHADKITYLSLLRACGNLGVLGLGKELHDGIVVSGFGSDLAVGVSLVNMYGKCGSLDEAHKVFDNLPKENVVLLNALMAGYALHGEHQKALQLSNEPHRQGLQPEDDTNTDSCNNEQHEVRLSMEHFNGLVNLLCQAGFLLEAEEILLGASTPLDVTGWTSLLFACRKYGNFELGQKCFQQLALMNSAPYGDGGNIF